MPFDPEQAFDEEDYPFVQSDLYDSVEPEATAPQESAASGSGLTVVTLHDEPGLGEGFGEMPAPVAPMDVEDEQSIDTPAPAPKKRGRPSRSASGTPAGATISKAGRPAKSTHSNKAVGRKRKAPLPQKEEEAATEESEVERQLSPAKRGRPTRTTATVASARLAAGATKKLTRGRPKNGTTTTNTGRPKKSTSNDATLTGEYEIEMIVDSMIDADTMEHMYLIKWKGYGDEENTWEPKANLSHASELVKAFDVKKKAAEKEAPAKLKERKKPGRKPKAKP